MSIRYCIDILDLHAHLYEVQVTVPEPSSIQTLSLPVWIPGSYLVREFARHISGVRATQNGMPLTVTQHDKCTWRVHGAEGIPLTVTYQVYAFDTSVRTAWLDLQRGFFNGTSVFMRVHGQEDQTQTVVLGLQRPFPAQWQVATAMTAVETQSNGCGTYQSANYDELVDHPFELGTFWRGHFHVHGIPHELVVAGALPQVDWDRLCHDAQLICEAQIQFWHGNSVEQVPFQRYVFMLNAVEEGYGGLEHLSSTALICNRKDLPHTDKPTLTDGYATLLGLISHEYFHTWNVKRLRPAELTRYDYTQENYTELLWFFEGFTSYYDDLMLVRTGLIDEQRYLKVLSKTISQVLSTPGRYVQSVAQASFDAWVKYYRPDENTLNATVSYYTKGSLVALALDLTLLNEGHGRLDEVMQTLWQQTQGGPITEALIEQVLAQCGQRSYAQEIQSWVHGTTDLPLQSLLEPLGIAWRSEANTLALKIGAKLKESAGSIRVQTVHRGGAAERCGLAAGDELIAFNEWRIRQADDLELTGALRQSGTLMVARNQVMHSLHWTPPDEACPPTAIATLSLNAQASSEQIERRQRWLHPSQKDPLAS